MAAVLREKKIKSADRVLEIFELFNEGRTAVTVMDVARALNAPQSSTSELLGTLVRRGYLSRERGERVFRPTSRVALLGAWVHPALFRNGSLLTMMDNLKETTRLGVALCSRVGISLKHVHAVGKVPEELSNGTERHLLHSPFGHVILSTSFSQEVRLLVQRINAESEPEDHVRCGDLLERLLEVSKRGIASGTVMPGWNGISVLLPRAVGEEQLAVGIIGRTGEIEARHDELVRCLRQAVANHIGPRIASGNFVPAPILRQSAMMA
ncbi:helix-turn-helix domain-containing protein [Sphingobium sp. JS3065]|uniref:helix-turn-helix domain-containing protein n=1 Tax=Sphingobium sp. JS3065 TaxID=2970925 RepID=UPI002263EA92|nr:helix-turn-helix domain-containing protein [Sphingobium sp. JS3065]UZW57355.1 helix-turn-helix domain-containing protein [Sphingobium sp. JS3065]